MLDQGTSPDMSIESTETVQCVLRRRWCACQAVRRRLGSRARRNESGIPP
jgi:hypothetical protein